MKQDINDLVFRLDRTFHRYRSPGALSLCFETVNKL